MRPYWLIHVRRADIPGILLGIAVLAIAIYLSVTYPGPFAKYVKGTVFGPDWTCQYVPNSDSVCIKDVPKRPPS